MRIRLASVAFMVAALACVDSIAAPGPASASCALSAEDLAANAKLSFDDFDQKGVTPATARKLGERGCFAEAALATRHYLIHAIPESYSRQVILTFHMAQYLASSGDEKTAAWVVASARWAEAPANAELDWNTYVMGTYAFLAKDRPLLEATTAALNAKPGVGNGINGRVLQGLLNCFDRPYGEAYGSEACMPPKT